MPPAVDRAAHVDVRGADAVAVVAAADFAQGVSVGRLDTKLNIPEGLAGPYSEADTPFTTSICWNCSIAFATVTYIVMPSTREFWKLPPCMPRVCGRRMSGPCCSW